MGRVGQFTGVALVFVMIGVSIMMNFRFGYSLGRTEIDALAYGIAGGAADCLKPLLPIVIAMCWREGEYAKFSGGVVLLVACIGYSTVSGFGFAAVNRADTAGARVVQADTYDRLQRQLADAEQQLKFVSGVRAADVVVAEINSALDEPVYRSRKKKRSRGSVGVLTKKCTRRSRWAPARERCRVIQSLRSELAAAKQAAELRQEVKRVSQQLNGVAKKGGGAVEAEPQVTLLRTLTGFESVTLKLALALSTALLVELISGWGLFVLKRKVTPAISQGVDEKQTVEEMVSETDFYSSINIPDLSLPKQLNS